MSFTFSTKILKKNSTYRFVLFPRVPGSPPGRFLGPSGSVLRRFGRFKKVEEGRGRLEEGQRRSEKVGEGWRKLDKVGKYEEVRKVGILGVL